MCGRARAIGETFKREKNGDKLFLDIKGQKGGGLLTSKRFEKRGCKNRWAPNKGVDLRKGQKCFSSNNELSSKGERLRGGIVEGH